MAVRSELVGHIHDVIIDMRSRTEGLDDTDESLWFIQGALHSMAQRDPEKPNVLACIAYAVYTAELLAATCQGVHVEIDGEDDAVEEVRAVGNDGTTQNVLSWMLKCAHDPDGDNVAFKYLLALRDFDQAERSAALYEQLEAFSTSPETPSV